MELRRKRRLTYFTIGVFYFLGGVEYAVILPTAWLYLKNHFKANTESLGLLLSAFSLAGLISSPIMGRICDKTHNTRAVLLVANCFEIVGSIMYFLGISTSFLIASRFIAGIGTGVEVCLFADIARATSTEERTGVMSIFMAVRQLGMVIGPACNLFLRALNFYIGDFIVDKYTSPGLFMAVMWILLQLLVLFLYWDLPRLRLQESLQQEQAAYNRNSIQEPLLAPAPAIDAPSSLVFPPTPTMERKKLDRAASAVSLPRPTPSSNHDMDNDSDYDIDSPLASSNAMIETVERYMGTSVNNTSRDLFDAPEPSSIVNNYGSIVDCEVRTNEDFVSEARPSTSINDGDSSSSEESDVVGVSRCRYFYNEFVREEVVAIVTTAFVAFFNQVSLEAMLTPLTESLLGWGEWENSLFFAGASVEIILVFLLIRFLSGHLADRTLLVLGFSVECITVAFFLWFLPQCIPHDASHNLPGLLIGCLVDVFGLPFLAVASTSLYSKVTREETQGFAQGIRRLFVGLGIILGPLWAGSMVSRHLHSMLGVMLGLNLIAAMMLTLSFKKLRVKEALNPSPLASDSTERQRLLA